MIHPQPLPADPRAPTQPGQGAPAADLASLLAAATADGSTVVAARLHSASLSAVVVRRTGWTPPSERGAVEVRRWRRASPAEWFPSRVGIYLDAATVAWLAQVLADHAATGAKEGA